MRLLVTGGAGFIGSEFVRATLARHGDTSIVVLDKLTYAGNLNNLEPVVHDARLTVVQGDIADPVVVNELAHETDAIVNFAAESHVDRSLEAPGQFIQTDVYGVFVLLEAARAARHDRFLHISTDEVYGSVPAGRSTEDSPLCPRNPYSASKAAGEMLVWSYRTSYNLPAIITRGSNTYGPYQFPEKIIPLFITNAIDDIPLPVYGDGSAVRDYFFVGDHVRGIDHALRHGTPGENYNLGAGNEISGVDIADSVLRLLGKPASLKAFVKDRSGHDRRYAMDSAKMRSLGWEVGETFEHGLAATVRWYAANEAWWRPLKSQEFWDFYDRNYQPAPAEVAPAP